MRLKQHLIALGEWSEERHARLEKELDAHVTACWKEAETYGTLTSGPTLDPMSMFEDVLREMPSDLVRQREELRALRAAQPAAAGDAAASAAHGGTPPVARKG